MTRLVAAVIALLVWLVPALGPGVLAQSVATKVMPLGDSITDGYNIPGGYRISLWQTLQQTGQAVDFVGSMSNGPASLGDKNHEGHSGWRIDQIDGSVNAWLSAAQPQVVLLMIGTNDMLQDYNVSGAPARLSALIDKITQQAPNAQVIVASLPPLSNAISNQRVQNFNAALPDIVRAKVAAGKKVSFVDMYPRLTTADLADGIHPNASGYAKLADAWYAALNSFLPPAGATPTPSHTATSTAVPTASATPLPGSESFFRAINLGGPAVTVDGHQWDASSAPNYSAAGAAQCNQWISFTPPADAARAAILGCWVQHWAHNIAVNGVPNGAYDVYLYVMQDWNDPNAQSFTLSVEGQTAASWTPGAAGSWARLGPFRRTISDGTLSVTSGGMANVAGVEIWTAGGTSATATSTATSTATATSTPTNTPTNTPTSTPAATSTATSTVTATNTPASTATSTATATNTPASTATSTATATSTPAATSTATPAGGQTTFYRAVNVNGPALTIDGNSWAANASATNFTINGSAMSNQWLAPSPSTDASRSSMIKSWRQHWALASTFSGIPNGTYTVYVYVVSDWNNPSPPTVTFRLEGTQVGAYVQGAAGSWAKLGPYTATISDGTINLNAEGVVNVSGIEVWRTN